MEVLNQPIHNVHCKRVVPILFHLLFCGSLLSFLLKHTTLHTLDISWPLCFILAFVLIFWRACSTITVGLMWPSKQSTPTVTTTPGVEGACCSCQCKANRCHKIAPPPPCPPEICHERSHFAFPPDHQTNAITGLRPSVKRAQICSSLPTACCSVSI